jgi:hypothetical protein
MRWFVGHNNRTPKRALQMESYPKFHNEGRGADRAHRLPRVQVHWRQAAARSPAHLSQYGAMPVRSSAPIALRYSVSIQAWAYMKLIRRIVLTVT